MEDKWKVLIYESPSGDRLFELLEQYGLEGAYPHSKKLIGTALWELRILGSDSIRILYITVTGKIFLLLHGFKKKTQKTPSREIAVAKKRLDEYQFRKIKD